MSIRPISPNRNNENDPDALEAAGHDLLARAARARIARRRVVLAIDPSTIYSTAAGGMLPPGRSRGWLRRHAHEIPGAIRHGKAKRGRDVFWTVTHAVYMQWVDARTAQVVAQSTTAAPVVDLDAWIDASGHRLTVRGGR